MSQPARLALLGYLIAGMLGALLGLKELLIAALLIGLLSYGTIAYQNFRLGRVMYHALEIVANRLGLAPVYKNGRA
jgi:hypothetical protein